MEYLGRRDAPLNRCHPNRVQANLPAFVRGAAVRSRSHLLRKRPFADGLSALQLPNRLHAERRNLSCALLKDSVLRSAPIEAPCRPLACLTLSPTVLTR